ncbi:MAG TPA: hypothetical protein PKY56_11825 [Candidatus Kapabacteria bacterium]|nr:hypothetical protein [Candidatus Kapabacteria bacterium]HPO62189.1 hypothetical protein [Candidatus Kapabacteria bacterium]
MEKRIILNNNINYNYITLRISQSRLSYGMIAIPRSLLFLFPEYSTDIFFFFNDSKILQRKKFIISEKNKEARIYGLSYWLKNNITNPDDEIVIQIIDKEKLIYRFISEKKFIQTIKSLENKFDNTNKEQLAYKYLNNLSNLNSIDLYTSSISQFIRLSKKEFLLRNINQINNSTKRSNVPVNIRVLLEKIYYGKCQICNFSFLKKDNQPYFELHHIFPDLEAHLKNICLVCANCHKQFTYANVNYEFNDGWLTQVAFNDKKHKVNQVINSIEHLDFYKNIYY